ncbi:hypothetical protein B0H14DRAFT_2648554 [Mycena olivaceomarginata]|nr:hypothetical protein B0H14DRAFT_2648554 [Mycena olivaceomarginata]
MAPLDFCKDTVFPARQDAIVHRLAEIKGVRVRCSWARKVAAVGVQWDLLERKNLVRAVKVIPTNMLSNICNMFCENYVEACLGVPNVVAWDSGGDEENTYKLVHIQSRGYPNSASKEVCGIVDPTKPVKAKKKEKGKGKKDGSDEDSNEEPGSEDEDEDGVVAGGGGASRKEGIVTLVESKLQPEKMWMGFCRFKEKTEQSKIEVRHRGEVVSDEEEALGARKAWRKEREAKEKREDVWKRSKKVKTKIEHKTYKQILAEVGQDMPASLSLGQIINATGAVGANFSRSPGKYRSATMILPGADVSLSSWSPSNDPTQIPDVQHNICLIAEVCKTDLEGLACEAKHTMTARSGAPTKMCISGRKSRTRWVNTADEKPVQTQVNVYSSKTMALRHGKKAHDALREPALERLASKDNSYSWHGVPDPGL